MLGVHPLRVRRRRPDIWSDDEGRRESAGQYTASNELPCFVVISQFKSSILNSSQSTDPAKRTAARVKDEPLTRHTCRNVGDSLPTGRWRLLTAKNGRSLAPRGRRVDMILSAASVRSTTELRKDAGC